MGHIGSKTRSIGQILEKACVRSRGKNLVDCLEATFLANILEIQSECLL